MKRLAIPLMILAAAASPALADQTAHLNSIVSTGEGPVTLGDLFDITGADGAVRVAPAVRAGGSAVVSAAEAQRIALAHGYRWANEGGLRNIIVYSGLTAQPALAPAAGSPAAVRAAAAAPASAPASAAA